MGFFHAWAEGELLSPAIKPLSYAFYADRILAAQQQRLEAIVEAAEPDQPVPAIIRVEQGQLPHGLK